MRVLQVNAVYKTKSTGRIAMELHNYFRNKGIDSYVAYATENTDVSNDNHIFRIGSTLDHKMHALAYRIDNMQGCHSTFATIKFLQKIEEIKPDIVLTHNLHSNYLNVPLFLSGLKKLNIPVILALHDCWFFTGGCYHYTAINCDGWLSGCNNCKLFGEVANKKYNINCEIFDEVKPTIIATSKWIEGEAKKSLLGSRSDIRMIYNWIDLETFYPRNDKHIRQKYGIGDKVVILGVATLWAAEKGQKEMIQVANAMPDVAVVLVGGQQKDAQYPPNVITVPFTDSKSELAELYSSADVFFNPSKQETFGLVSGEALACGTPLVVYDTTACPEFVTEHTGVIMAKNSDVVTAVKQMLNKNAIYGRDFEKQKCREFVEDNFNINKNIDKYIDLFEEITHNK